MIMFTKQHLLTYVHRIYVYNTYSFVYHPIQTQTVTFKRDSAAPIELLHRRVGRPRKQWTFESLKITWSKIRTDHSNFVASPTQLERIHEAAINQQIWNNYFMFLTRFHLESD